MNYLLMSYGQTSSGKSFTINGEKDNIGLIPRFLADLFSKKSNFGEEGYLQISYSLFEIYKEKIYDCLESDSRALMLREQPGKEVFIEGLITKQGFFLSEMLEDLTTAIARRKAGETLLNGRSSRSHFVFTLDISLTTKLSSEASQFSITKKSRVTFVDLAGSEKQKNNFKETFQEGCSINKSLSVLVHIVGSLAKRSPSFLHFRDSKLTHFLKDCFSGDAHISIIANILTKKEFLPETISTLSFISAARRVQIDPHFNVESEPSEKLNIIEGCRLIRKELSLLHALIRDEAVISNLKNLYEHHISQQGIPLLTTDYIKATSDLHAHTLNAISTLRQNWEKQNTSRDQVLRQLSASLDKMSTTLSILDVHRSYLCDQVTRPSFYQSSKQKILNKNVILGSSHKHKRSSSLHRIVPDVDALHNSTFLDQLLKQKDKEIDDLKKLLEAKNIITVDSQSSNILSRKIANLERQLRNRNKDYLCAVKEIEKLKLELLHT